MTIETSQELQMAIDGDRASTRELLASFARGEFGTDARAWLNIISARLLDADDEPDARRRPEKIMRALGLAGRGDPDRRLVALVSAFDSFENLDDPKAGLQTSALAQEAKGRGLISELVDHGDAVRKVGRVRARLRK